MPNAPVAARNDDICFVNESIGWVVNSNGQIFKTTDSGETWKKQFQSPAYFRSVGFADTLKGWAGGHGITTATTDGGSTRIEDNFGRL